MTNDLPPRLPSLHWPVFFLALTFAILLGAQIGAATQATSTMKWQTDTLSKQITEMQTMDKRFAEAIKNRETMVKQSTELQSQLQNLLTDLLELAKTDNDAKQIAEKWKIQRSQPPAGAAAPADAAP